MLGRRIRGRWWTAGLLLASVIAGAPAAAQGKAAPPVAAKAAPAAPGAQGAANAADQEKEAEKLFRAGVEAAKAGHWEQAREFMLRSFELKPTAARAANLGGAELKTDRPRDAAEHLTYLLKEAQGLADEDRKAAESLLAEAKAKIGTVTIVGDDGAEVLVDGQSVGKAPLSGPVFLTAGSHRFEAKKEGAATATQDVQVAAGSAPTVELKPAVKPVTPPLTGPGTGAGDGTGKDTAGNRGSPKWRTGAIAGAGALAVVGFGVGIGSTVAANAKSKDAAARLDALAKNTPTTSFVCGTNGFPPNVQSCKELKDTLRSQDHLTNAAVAGYVIGGVAALGTVALVLLPKLQARRAMVQVVPTLGSNHGGMTVAGAF